MLIRFVVTNFFSFDKETEFNMLTGTFKTHKHHVYELGKVNVLKAAAIYGANGAGKSNLVYAIHCLMNIVNNGEIKPCINNNKFKLNKVNEDLPVNFEIEFSINNKFFSYGVSINQNIVIHEWLYETGINKEDKLIFERKISKTNKPIIRMADKYLKTQKSKLLIELMEDNLLKNNELLIGKSDNLKINDIILAKRWFEEKLYVIFPETVFGGLVQKITTSERFKSFTNELLKRFDTGVKELSIESLDFDKFFGEEEEDLKKDLLEALEQGESFPYDTDSGTVIIIREGNKFIVKDVVSIHENNKGENVKFDLSDESDGTQRLLDFIPSFDYILNDDITFIIDEIDRSLHPALLKALINKIMADTTTKGQLIFTTHESNLLDMDLFRQDEIWFAEKNKKTGGTELYSLSEFKPRYDLDIRKGYLKGRFGAIPFLANLQELNWHSYDKKEERV